MEFTVRMMSSGSSAPTSDVLMFATSAMERMTVTTSLMNWFVVSSVRYFTSD